MPELPTFLKAYLGKYLLGRLRLKLYEEISGRRDYLPGHREIRRYVFQQYRTNVGVARLLTSILFSQFTKAVDYKDVGKPVKITALLDRLEEQPLEGDFFLELNNCPDPWPDIVGALVHCEVLRDGGYVYVITLFDEKSFPTGFIGHLEIRASKEHPEPMFAVLSKSGFKPYTLRTYKKSIHVNIALKALKFISQNPKRRRLTVEEAVDLDFVDHRELDPPTDERLVDLIQLALKGELKCARTKVLLSSVQPHDFSFCMSYPVDVIKRTVRDIENGIEGHLLVYWNGSNFIMSDDYSYYLSYRSLKYEDVPVVIIGEFPDVTIGPVEIGGADLLPMLLSEWGEDLDSLPPDVKNWILDNRLQNKGHKSVAPDLYVLFIILATMLQNPSTKEKELHEFILNNPTTLDPYGSCIMSEVRLADKYRIDLVVQYKLEEKQILLVELEKASLPIFTKTGRLRSHVTHAIQQVEDWLRWWREYPDIIPKALDGSIPPQGLVVIGRNINLDDDSKRRLIHLNHDRLVKVITYDELLDRIENLINSLEAFEETDTT